MFAAINAFLTRAVSGYFLNKSLRFRSSASAYLNRTPATTGTGGSKTWTYSGWVKRGVLGTRQSLLDGYDASRGHVLEFQTTDTLDFYGWGAGAAALDLNTTQVFRDPAAWYHIVLAVDTTQATASDRIKMYVNGSQITSFGTATYPAQNVNTYISSNVVQDIGRRGDAQYYTDGELAEVNFVDGYPTGITQALWASTNIASSFGAFSTYNQWLPKKYTGTYGTNGFYLPFTNTTSTSTLVADASGNANNWTPNNISLTAGSTYDSLTDVPTLTSTTVANYAVLNPLVPSANTFSSGNLQVTTSASPNAKFVSTMGVSSGKYYMEFGFSTIDNVPIGVTSTTDPQAYLGAADGTTSVSFWPGAANTAIYVNGVLIAWTGSGTTWANSDIAGLALDADAKTISLYKNGVLVGAAYSYAYWTGTTYFAGGNYVSGKIYYANFGQRPFAYSAPTGFLPLNTFNI